MILVVLATSPALDVAQAAGSADQIVAIANASACRSAGWKDDNGKAPAAYVRGLALVFARSVCHADRPDVKVVSAARGPAGGVLDKTDALAWYDSEFANLGMSNVTNGVDTLRHVYTLMFGLGIRESSGRYCVGRDTTADFTAAESAEAGLFQTSWGVSKVDPSLPDIFTSYQADHSGCLLDVFSKGVTCGAGDAKTWGTGTGASWQELTKACPAFSAEYAAVVLRKSGGSKGEFGPIRKRVVELKPECDAMLLQVQQLVQASPDLCSGL